MKNLMIKVMDEEENKINKIDYITGEMKKKIGVSSYSKTNSD